jgi:amino acid permease
VVGLKATLGLMQGCTIIVGSIIGSGIFIAPGGVLKAGLGPSLELLFCFSIVSFSTGTYNRVLLS